jgi:hypothetical protein
MVVDPEITFRKFNSRIRRFGGGASYSCKLLLERTAHWATSQNVKPTRENKTLTHSFRCAKTCLNFAGNFPLRAHNGLRLLGSRSGSIKASFVQSKLRRPAGKSTTHN